MSIQTATARPWARFTLHFAEMLVAMFAGMFLLAPLWPATASVTVGTLVMATNMTIGMSLVMALRRHSVRSMAEMGAAMYLSFLVFLVPFWFDAVSATTVMIGGHVLMVPAMLGAMLLRRDEYLHHH